jgi:hypothetical protein
VFDDGSKDFSRLKAMQRMIFAAKKGGARTMAMWLRINETKHKPDT